MELKDYKNYKIETNYNSNVEIRGFCFWANILKSGRHVFTEITEITDIAITIKFGHYSYNPVDFLKNLTLNKVIARIDYGLIELDKTYRQTIDSNSINTKIINKLSSIEIQDVLIKALFYNRKNNSIDYKNKVFPIETIASIIEINDEDLKFELSILEEKELVKIIHENEKTIVHITIKGIEMLNESANQQDIEEKSDRYDVAFSFAGEDREIVQELADILISKGVKVFYDKYEKSTLWGKNLYDYLSILYSERANYCVMVISKNYKDKLWTNHERKAAQSKAFKSNKEYILPLRLDSTEITGILDTTGYIYYSDDTPENICNLIIEKINNYAV